MEWDSPRSQEELVKYLEEVGYLSSPKIRDVLLQVDRGRYCKGLQYRDCVKDIGCNAIISAPHMHAHVLQKLERHLVAGARALDVGAGSGYLTVCMAVMVGARGRVVGLEHMDELVNVSGYSVTTDKPHLLRQRILKFVVGDGRRGYPAESPYDVIHVGAAVEKIPDEMLYQLAPGGRMVIPVGRGDSPQTLVIVDKDLEGNMTETHDAEVRNIPLTDVKSQMGPFMPQANFTVRQG